MRELEESVSEWQARASELERERDEARESALTGNRPYLELEREHQREVAAHQATKQSVTAARAAALALLVLLIGLVLVWWFVLR